MYHLTCVERKQLVHHCLFGGGAGTLWSYFKERLLCHGMAQLGTVAVKVKPVMEMQIGAAWFDTSQPKRTFLFSCFLQAA